MGREKTVESQQCPLLQKPGYKVRDCERKFASGFEIKKSREVSMIMAEESGVAIIIVMVIRMRVATRRWKNQEYSRRAERNGVVITTVIVIRARNATAEKWQLM